MTHSKSRKLPGKFEMEAPVGRKTRRAEGFRPTDPRPRAGSGLPPPKNMNKFLLVNLNNTSTKLALSDEERLLKKAVIPTKKLTAAGVRRILDRWSFDFVLVGSVVPQKTAIFRRSVKVPLLEITPKLDLGIGIDFPRPETIGADRIANAVSVTRRHGTPAVVVDFGTAVTFDIISRAGDYIGGVIAPGLGAMTDYLYQKTALLPKIDLE